MKEERDLNPYTAPSTPSDEMSNKPNPSEEGIFITDTGAYRVGSSLFCTADFISPPICLQSGLDVRFALEKTTLSAGSISISIYLTQQLKNRFNWDIIYMLFIALAFTALRAYFMLGIIIPALVYGFKIPKNHRIKAREQADGFIEVLNVHPDFLSYFPTKKEREATTV